jgi:hypothetical protein
LAFDNASIHELAKEVLPAGQVLKVPKWSPDFMKVIEHNHGYVVDHFHKQLEAETRKNRHKRYTAVGLRKKLKQSFFAATSKEGVQNDLAKYWEMLTATINEKGDYGSRDLR